MSQAKFTDQLRGADLIAEYRRLNAVCHAPYLLLFTMPGCESCDCLKEDLPNIKANSAFHTMLCVTVSPDDNDSCGLAAYYALQDFPTAIVMLAGKAVSGWSGHDRVIPTVERRAALSKVIERALVQASHADQVAG